MQRLGSFRRWGYCALLGNLICLPATIAGPFSCDDPPPEGSLISLKAVAVNGVPIAPTSCVAASAGDVIRSELRLSGWGADMDDLGAYQATILAEFGSISGQFGNVIPLGWDLPSFPVVCGPPPDDTACDFDPDLYCSPSKGRCIGPNHDPSLGVFIDPTHPEFVFADYTIVEGVNISQVIYLVYFALVLFPFDGPPDDGFDYYGGTLILEVSDDACGTFRFRIVDDIERTLFSDPTFLQAILPALQSLQIIIPTCDCNENGTHDHDDIASGLSLDCNLNGVPDECEPGCGSDGVPDECVFAECDGSPDCGDCNLNGIPDECDIASGFSLDSNEDGRPDECFIPIPTITSWGLIALSLALLCLSKITFGGQASKAAA